MNIKLSIATAALVCSTAVFGGGDEDIAQVYDISITVKTTQAKKGKLTASTNPFVAETSTVIYRKQASEKWSGLVWGCGCETSLGVWRQLPQGGVSGVVVWNTKKPYDIILLDDMSWHVLNAIGVKGNEVECAWTIGESINTSSAFLAFSGFGTISLATEKVDGSLEIIECASTLKNVRGNVAGWMQGPTLMTSGRRAVCTFCGVVEEGTEDSVEVAEAWPYCPCTDIDSTELTSVSGTWTLKLNASLSKALLSKTSILEVYKKFPASVSAAVAAKIATVSEE